MQQLADLEKTAVEGGALMGILSVAKLVGLLEGNDQRVRERLRRHFRIVFRKPLRDRRVVARGVFEGFQRESAARCIGEAARFAQFGHHCGIVRRVA